MNRLIQPTGVGRRCSRSNHITGASGRVSYRREPDQPHARNRRAAERRGPGTAAHAGRGPGRAAAPRGGVGAHVAERGPLRTHAERGHGLGPRRGDADTVSRPEHPRRAPGRARPPDRPRLPHRPLGGRPPGARGGGGDPRRGRAAVRGVLHGPLRRPDAGHAGDDGQPAVPQRRGDRDAPADPLPAAPRGGPRGRDVRQGAARGDAGPRRVRRPAGRARPRRGDAARRGGRGPRRRAVARRAVRPRDRHPRRGRGPRVPRLRLARGRLPVPRHGRHGAGGGRGARPLAPPQRARPLGRAGVARHGPPLRARTAPARRAGNPPLARADGRGRRERDARPRGLRRLDEPRAPPAGGRARGRAQDADRRRLAAGEPRDAAPRGRAPQRAAQPPDRARVPGRRRAGGPPPPAADGPAAPERAHGDGRDARRGPRLVGGERAARGG